MSLQVRVNLADAELKDGGNGAAFVARIAPLGEKIGLHGLGCTLTVVPPGKCAYPFHRHHVADEMFYILSGSGDYRQGAERFPVKAGDLIGAPAGGEAHQLVNTGQEELRYLAISTLPSADILEYPDSGKVAYGAGAKNGGEWKPTIMALGRLTPADYFDGEGVS